MMPMRMPSVENNNELRAKLTKWKARSAAGTAPPLSASTDNKFNFDFGQESSGGGAPALPEKPVRFQHMQLKKLLEGKLNPPKNKKWSEAGVKALFDKVDVQLKFEEMNRMKPNLEELYKGYEVPMVLASSQP